MIFDGNFYRIKKFLQKAKSGDDVYIAAIGGSVTEGAGPAKFTDGYAYQFFRKVQQKYGRGHGSAKGENFHFCNAGLSGSSSLTGIVRYKKDVVDVLGTVPDLLIIEFAVNDDGGEIFQRSFEALVRTALLSNENMAVIALYCAATYGNSSQEKKPIADYYQIPQIEILSEVEEKFESGEFTKEWFYADYVHPTYEGHKYMCNRLIELLEMSKCCLPEQKKQIAVPEKSFIEPSFYGMIQISADIQEKAFQKNAKINENECVKIERGVFNCIDEITQTIKKTNSVEFTNNWHYKGDEQSPETKNKPFKMEIFCKNLIMIWKNQAGGAFKKFGKAEVLVDGKQVTILDGGKQGGWNNCVPNVIIDEEVAKNHTVEVKMCEDSKKLGCTILSMGYTK